MTEPVYIAADHALLAPHTRRGLLARLGRATAALAMGSRFDFGTAFAQSSRAPFPDSLELAVSFSFKQPTGRYNRPYTAVWIEDENGTPVRTLSLWANLPKGSKYLADLRRWFKGDQKRRSNGGVDLPATVTGPTRLPGSYTVTWDGRNDKGVAMPQGNYVLNLEMAREDGPYQRVRQPLEIGTTAFKKKIDDQGELTDVTAEMRARKA